MGCRTNTRTSSSRRSASRRRTTRWSSAHGRRSQRAVPRTFPSSPSHRLRSSTYPPRRGGGSIRRGRDGAASSLRTHSRPSKETRFLPPTAFARVSNRSLLEGSSLALNASGSSDRDGLVVAYAVDWGNGATSEWSSSPIFQHTYAPPGSFVITVFAKDDSGAVAETTIAIDVHSRLPQTILDVLPILVPIVALAAGAGPVLRRVLLRRPKRPASESRVGEPVPPSESMTTATEPEAKP